MQNQTMQERCPIVDIKVGAAVDDASIYSNPVNMADIGRLRSTTVLNSVDTTSDVVLQLCDSDGGNPVDITGKAATQAGAGDDGKAIVLEIRNDEIPQATGQTYVRTKYTAGDGASGNDVTIITEQADVGFQSATGHQSASVLEYVV